MRVDLFDFDLPPERIALRPAVPRETARLLEVRSPTDLVDRRVGDLPQLFAAGDVLVVNDTRVIPARLTGTRTRNGVAARIEVTLHKRESATSWRAFVRPAKKLHAGERLVFDGSPAPLSATCEMHFGEGEVLLAFSEGGEALDGALLKHGSLPLPPYIAGKRPVDDRDRADYQTMFAQEPGAVAAPTASLHFTADLVEAIEARGVRILPLTLHVGAGTFLPVKAEDTDDHRMHAEWGRLDGSAATLLNEARTAGGRIIAAGTTSLRLLESAAREDGTVTPFEGDTSIFITPGYRFRATDMLLTNFHLPRSTLFMLVAAFSGLDTMHAAYEHAIAEGYRFYSYGDASLLHRSAGP